MELPIELKNAIDVEIEKRNVKDLQQRAENISLRYRTESGKGKKLVTEELEALSYAAVRMPATYSAIYTALKNTLEIYDEKIESVLDVGAGTGAGSWAVSNLAKIEKITCLEREDVMMNFGKLFMQKSEIDVLENAEWKKFDLLDSNIDDKADLVICSYVLNELNSENRLMALKKLWNSTKKILLIIEPGTPVGFTEIKELRDILIKDGGEIIAPCPHSDMCKMSENDWCHATCRVSRTKTHKILKNGDVPYEDEKFSYIAVCKDNIKKENYARVLRHPKIESGKITLQICSKDGISEKIITKKNKELFKVARKLKCGDAIKNI